MFAERHAKHTDVFYLKRKLHWSGLLATYIFAAAAVDLYAIRAWYAANVTPWLLANAAVVLVSSLWCFDVSYAPSDCGCDSFFALHFGGVGLSPLVLLAPNLNLIR